MLYLFIIYSLNDCSFTQQYFVRNTHHGTFHVAFEFGNKLYSVHKKLLKQVLADIAFICNQLVEYLFDEAFVLKRFSVINISRSNREVQKFSLLIADQMQLEAEEPAHGTLAPCGKALECPVHMYPLIAAYSQRCRVHKADSGTFSKQNLLYEDNHGYDYLLLKFYESIVGYCFWKKMFHVPAYVLYVEMLQAAEAGIVEQDHYNHYLSIRHCRIPMILASGVF